MIAIHAPTEVLSVLPLLLALSGATILWTKYFVQITKGVFDWIKQEPAHANTVRGYSLTVGACSLLGLSLFFGSQPITEQNWRVIAATLVFGAADGGAAIADYHLLDFLRGLPIIGPYIPPDPAVLASLAPGTPAIQPPAPEPPPA